MVTILPAPALTFDDVSLVPRYSDISSRYDESINTETNIGGLVLNLPIISANMDTVTEYQMANTMYKNGGLGIIHRFMSPIDQVKQLARLNSPKIVCIGIGDTELERLKYITGEVEIDGVLIDIAHGHSRQMLDQTTRARTLLGNKLIIAGNVCSRTGVRDLNNAGATCCKAGVGNGSLCTTRRQTGNGVPQFSALLECCKPSWVPIIADGGIRCAGDIVKSLAAGAAAVMVGNLLAGCDETPGPIYQDHTNHMYKVYRGMASAEAQLSWRGDIHSVEGESMRVPYKGPATTIVEELRAGLRSGMSYQGAHNLHELQTNAVFCTQSHAGYIEGLPHGKL